MSKKKVIVSESRSVLNKQLNSVAASDSKRLVSETTQVKKRVVYANNPELKQLKLNKFQDRAASIDDIKPTLQAQLQNQVPAR